MIMIVYVDGDFTAAAFLPLVHCDCQIGNPNITLNRRQQKYQNWTILDSEIVLQLVKQLSGSTRDVIVDSDLFAHFVVSVYGGNGIGLCYA